MYKKKKRIVSDNNSLLWRYLADSNRRRRFCRPLPSHSAKVPLWFADAKVLLIFGLPNLSQFFCAFFCNKCSFCRFFVVLVPWQVHCEASRVWRRGQWASLQVRHRGSLFFARFTVCAMRRITNHRHRAKMMATSRCCIMVGV